MSHYVVKPVAEAAIVDYALCISRDGLSSSKAFVDHIYDQFQFLAGHPEISRYASVSGET